MKKREANRKILFIFILCAVAIVVVTWTVSEKFIPDARIAFFVNICAAICIAWMFELYLESRLNTSIDFIIGKISRIAKGDLTQVFKEDPDDILPYGLSYQLGDMMKSFRENIGKLWRTSSLLVKQLNMFISSAQEVLKEFRTEVGFLSEVRLSIDSIRADTSEIARYLSALKVNAGSDITLMQNVQQLCGGSTEGLAKSKDLHKQLLDNMANLRDSLNHVQEAMNGFSDLSRQARAIEKAMGDLTTQTSLVKLNASIDATQQQPAEGNYEKLVEETRKIAQCITDLANQSSSAVNVSDEKIRQFAAEMDQRRIDMKKGLDNVNQSFLLLQAMQEKNAAASQGYGQVSDHAGVLNELLVRIDNKVSEFSNAIKGAEAHFDKLYSDANLTLLKFNDLGSKIDILRDNLQQLEEFNRLFQIA